MARKGGFLMARNLADVWPLPSFRRVKEVVQSGPDEPRSVCLIVPAEESGRKNVYHVLRIFLRDHTVSQIGVELPIGLARLVAYRRTRHDGKPVLSNPVDTRDGSKRQPAKPANKEMARKSS